MSRVARWLGGGALCALALHALLPGAESPGLRGLLVVAPLVAALLASVAERIGARRWSLEEAAGAVAVIALVAGQDRLDLPHTDRLAALAVFALVAVRIVRLAPALRRALRLPTLARTALFAAVPFAAYLAILPWADAARPPDGDEPYYLLLAESLASDLDVDLSDEYRAEAWRSFGDRPIEPQPGDPVGPQGQLYSRHDPLLPLILVPFWVLGGLPGARLALLLICATLAAATLEASRALGVRDRGAFGAWALAAFAPPALSLSCQIWVELPAALLAAIALAAFGRTLQEGGRWTRRRAAAFAIALALLPLLKLRFLAVAAPLALLGALAGRARGATRLVAASLVTAAAAALLAANAWIWDNPLRMHTPAELALFDVPLERFVRGGLGLGFDVAFGLFATAPLWLLAVPGALRALRRPRAVALALAAFAPYFLLVASRREWYGGWSPAFRYGIVALPVLAATAGVLLERRAAAGARVLIVLLAGITALRAAAVLAEPGWAFHLANGRSTLLDLASSQFAADVARLFPSTIRVRPATWIVPALVLAALGLALRWPRGRPRDATTAGVALGLLLWGGAVVLAHRLPTRTVHVEDPWVEKSGGRLWPDRWIVDRTRFDSGWALFGAASVRIPVVPGSERARLEVRWQGFPGAPPGAGLELLLGERRIATLPVEAPGEWRRDEVRVTGWREGDGLVLRYAVPPGRPRLAGLVVDRIELDWR